MILMCGDQNLNGCNQIGVSGASATTNLTSLNLSWNQIVDDVKTEIRNRLRQTHPTYKFSL
jgi:hypothetical protein